MVDDAAQSRLIAIGSAALVDGFGLLGFETHPDVTKEGLGPILNELIRSDARALVILESDLARCDCEALQRIRADYVRIVVVEVPALQAPEDYHPEVEQLVRSVLGPAALNDEGGLA